MDPNRDAGVPEKFEKRKSVFNFWPLSVKQQSSESLSLTDLVFLLCSARCEETHRKKKGVLFRERFHARSQAVKVSIFGGFQCGNPTETATASMLF